MSLLPLLAVDWTVIGTSAVTGATAVVVALIGYYGTRLAARMSRVQADTETARAREVRTAERRAHRQEIYWDLLTRERPVVPILADADTDRTERLKAVVELTKPLTGAILFGTEEVARRATEVARALETYRDAAARGVEPPEQAFDELIRARRVLISAMRRDVAADSMPIAGWEDSEILPAAAGATAGNVAAVDVSSGPHTERP
jgi:hypothetical protein